MGKNIYYVDPFRSRATSSYSLLWEPAIWYPRVAAEVVSKLLTPEQVERRWRAAKRAYSQAKT
jgi:hypothetical protein